MTVLKVGDTKQQVEAFLQLIVKRMKEMGVAYQKNVKKNVKIEESEVSQKSVAQTDIQNLMLNIENYEEAINDGVLDINTIQTLTTLYPKAIEYFSAFDNNMYNDLLNRMQSLL